MVLNWSVIRSGIDSRSRRSSSGVSVGIAGASALLALSLAAATGLTGSTMDASAPTLVAAGRDVILLLCCFVALAGALSLMRTVPRKTRGTDDGEPEGVR